TAESPILALPDQAPSPPSSQLPLPSPRDAHALLVNSTRESSKSMTLHLSFRYLTILREQRSAASRSHENPMASKDGPAREILCQLCQSDFLSADAWTQSRANHNL